MPFCCASTFHAICGGCRKRQFVACDLACMAYTHQALTDADRAHFTRQTAQQLPLLCTFFRLDTFMPPRRAGGDSAARIPIDNNSLIVASCAARAAARALPRNATATPCCLPAARRRRAMVLPPRTPRAPVVCAAPDHALPLAARAPSATLQHLAAHTRCRGWRHFPLPPAWLTARAAGVQGTWRWHSCTTPATHHHLHCLPVPYHLYHRFPITPTTMFSHPPPYHPLLSPAALHAMRFLLSTFPCLVCISIHVVAWWVCKLVMEDKMDRFERGRMVC